MTAAELQQRLAEHMHGMQEEIAAFDRSSKGLTNTAGERAYAAYCTVFRKNMAWSDLSAMEKGAWELAAKAIVAETFNQQQRDIDHAVRAEREECAKIADQYGTVGIEIRARGGK